MHRSTDDTSAALTEKAATAAFSVIGGAVVRGGVTQPISNATLCNGMLFVAGQVPMRNGQPAASDIEGQTDYVIDMIAGILAQAGCGLEHIVKVTVWLTDPQDYAGFHTAYGRRFAQAPYPARSTVISQLIAPVKIEMEVVAALPQSTTIATP